MTIGQKLIWRDSELEHAPFLAAVFTSVAVDETKDTPYDYIRHIHREYELIYVDKGIYLCDLNDQSFTLRAGDFLCVKPGDVHSDFCKPPLRYFSFCFRLLNLLASDTSFVPVFREDLPSQDQIFSLTQDLRPIIRMILSEHQTPDVIGLNSRNALLQYFFWQIIRQLPTSHLSKRLQNLLNGSDFATRLISLFKKHSRSRLKVSQMASELNMSESAFAHTCQEVLEISPANAFMNYKMRQARLLLSNTSQSIKEISSSLGFSNQYHFSRNFKHFHGLSPREARKPRN